MVFLPGTMTHLLRHERRSFMKNAYVWLKSVRVWKITTVWKIQHTRRREAAYDLKWGSDRTSCHVHFESYRESPTDPRRTITSKPLFRLGPITICYYRTFWWFFTDKNRDGTKRNGIGTRFGRRCGTRRRRGTR